MANNDDAFQIDMLQIHEVLRPLIKNGGYESLLNGPEEIVEATPENLRKALKEDRKESLLVDHYHEASGMIFKLRPMSSKAYIDLENIVQFDPTNPSRRVGNLRDDAFRMNQLTLIHGVDSPTLTEDDAASMLKKDGWGGSNLRMLDAISELNPPAKEFVNNTLINLAISRFVLIWLMIGQSTGVLKELYTKFGIKEDVQVNLDKCIEIFKHFVPVDEAAAAWGLPLTHDELVSKQALVDLMSDKREDDELEDDELEDNDVESNTEEPERTLESEDGDTIRNESEERKPEIQETDSLQD